MEKEEQEMRTRRRKGTTTGHEARIAACSSTSCTRNGLARTSWAPDEGSRGVGLSGVGF